MGESQIKLVDVQTPEAARYAVGDEVQVSEEQRMALRAVLVAYGGALVVLLLGLIGALLLGLSEGWAALLSLSDVVLYYAGVYLLLDRIKRTIHFTISKC